MIERHTVVGNGKYNYTLYMVYVSVEAILANFGLRRLRSPADLHKCRGAWVKAQKGRWSRELSKTG